MPTIGALNIYPVKSCKGVPLRAAILTNAGLLFDREWMVVRADTGKFISQRENSKLALVAPSLPGEVMAGEWRRDEVPADAIMTLNAPGMEPLRVQLAPRPPGEVRKVTVWEWTGAGSDEGEEAAAWFSSVLGLPCRLVRYLGSAAAAGAGNEAAAAAAAPEAALPLVRTTEPEYAVDYETRFSDGYPMLMVTQSALSDLNTKLAEPLPMNRFRPNIEVAGADPWAEDGWRDMTVTCSKDESSTVRLTSVKPCSRCKMTTINQVTAEVGDEPLDTLGTIRSGQVLGWNEKDRSLTHAVFFGWNVVSRTPGRLSVGDVVTVDTPQQPKALTPAA